MLLLAVLFHEIDQIFHDVACLDRAEDRSGRKSQSNRKIVFFRNLFKKILIIFILGDPLCGIFFKHFEVRLISCYELFADLFYKFCSNWLRWMAGTSERLSSKFGGISSVSTGNLEYFSPISISENMPGTTMSALTPTS